MKELDYKIYGLKLIGQEQIYYVGRTITTLSARWSKHKTNARLSKTNNHRSNWINKHKDEIEIILIEGGITTKEEACDKERYYIAFYREKYGSLVNSSDGGDGGCEGYKHTEEAKVKISKAHKGRKFSEEHIKNISNRFISEETRKKMSENSKKYILENGNPMTGKKRPDNAERNKERVGIKASEYTKEKMSKSKVGNKNPNYKHGKRSKEYQRLHKKEFKLTQKIADEIRELYSTGNFTYKNLSEVYNVTPAHIGSIIRGLKWNN